MKYCGIAIDESVSGYNSDYIRIYEYTETGLKGFYVDDVANYQERCRFYSDEVNIYKDRIQLPLGGPYDIELHPDGKAED